MAPDRTRFTHTDPNQIGGKYIGTIEPALRGETFTEVYTGTLGPSIRAVAPVRDSTGRIVGLVSAGILQQSLAARWRSQVPTSVCWWSTAPPSTMRHPFRRASRSATAPNCKVP